MASKARRSDDRRDAESRPAAASDRDGADTAAREAPEGKGREGPETIEPTEEGPFSYGLLEARPEPGDVSQGPHYHYLLEFCHTHPGSHEKRPANWRQEHVTTLDADHRSGHLPLPGGFEAFLEGRIRFGMKVGLENIRALLAALHLDRGHPPVILVAGTNGKGTVAHALGDAFAVAGYRPGVYTSPHVEHFLERIQVSNNDPDEEALEGACTAVRKAVEALDERSVHCTYFEVGTALALEVFRRQKAFPLVLEVGMGGRADAVNALEPAVTLITNVGSDHAEHLGHTLQERVHEKAGIMRRGVPCFTSAQGEALRLLEQEAIARGTPLIPVLPAEPPLPPQEALLSLVRAMLADRSTLSHYPRLIDLDATTVRLPRLPGRQETFVLPEGRTVLLDVAHNTESFAALAARLDEEARPVPRVLLTGLLQDKPTEALAQLARHRFDAVHVTRPLGDRARGAAGLAAALEDAGVAIAHIEEDPEQALLSVLTDLPPGGRLVVAGSFYLAAAVRPLLRRVREG